MTDIETTVTAMLDGVAEVRVLGVQRNGPWDGFAKGVVSGFFDDRNAMIDAISKVDKGGPTGIYVTLNPVHPDLIALAQNRLKAAIRTTDDAHILKYRWIPIDIDPIRITGISSSEEELKKALEVTEKIESFLAEHQIDFTIKAHSGNGYHLLIAIDEPNTPATTELVKNFLAVLAEHFNTDTVKIDVVNCNAARIWKAYGTMSRKGDNIQSRPHRKSSILETRDRIVVSRDVLTSFVMAYMPPEPERPKLNNHKFDLKTFLVNQGIEIVREKSHGSSVLYGLKHCVFNQEHVNNEAAFGQTADGTLFYQCFHNSCQGKTWHDAKQVMGWKMSAGVSRCQQMSANVIDSQPNSAQVRIQKAYGNQNTVANLVKQYIEQAPGIFTVNEIDNELCLRTREEKNCRASELNRLKKQGFIRQVPGKRGTWKIVDGNLQPMDFNAARPEPLPIVLPLGVSELVNIYPRNIIIIAGSSNAGKSAYVSTLIRVNNNILTNLGADVSKTPFEQMAPFMCTHPKQTKPDVHFFSSEAGTDEMAQRLSEHPGGLEAFAGINFWERERDFAEVIDPNGINVIDYMEVYDNFYEIGAWINDVHRELRKGIAIIVIQKKRGTDVGKGGEVTLEKPRLYLSLENNVPYGGICKIIKAKFPKDPKNDPNGKEIDYQLSHGCVFTELSEWQYVDERKRKELNKKYEMSRTQRKSNGKYIFEFKTIDGKIAGLTPDSFNQWQQAYPGFDLSGYLDRIQRDSERRPFMDKNWYFQLAGMIQKESQRRG